MRILERALHQRAYDGKIEELAKVLDHSQEYTYVNEEGIKKTTIPTKWICTNVREN